MLGADAGVLRVNDLGSAGSEAPKHLHVLVIYVVEVLGTKEALFIHDGLL